VICIGVGVNGIMTAIRFLQKIRNLKLTVYKKNADVGGTWFEHSRTFDLMINDDPENRTLFR
jgi:cation diffusion facilitator CzcD-associated flavoprotein CzcO